MALSKQLTNYATIKFFRLIRKLCEYSPALWNDTDWEYEDMVHLFQYKLSRMRRSMRMLQDQSDILQVETLFGLYLDCNFGTDYLLEEHKQKWNDFLLFETRSDGDFVTHHCTVSSEDAIRDWTAIYARRNELRRECLKQAFEIIETRLERWWS